MFSPASGRTCQECGCYMHGCPSRWPPPAARSREPRARHRAATCGKRRASGAPGTPNGHNGRIQFKRMECKEKQRLTEEYFDAFKRQQWIRQRLNSIRADADSQLISVGETQAEVATEECYDAWQALNEHQCSERCKCG